VSPFDQLHPAVRYHIVNTLGWTDLRPTQLEAIQPIQGGEDVLLLAPTAGGKTEAAVLPLLSRMAIGSWRGLSVLYICPLRALLNNLEPRLQRYASMIGRRAALWHGDVGAAARRRLLADPPDLLMTTPESVEAMLISRRIDHAAFFSGVQSVIVDELHAFAGDDRGWHLLFLLERLEHLTSRRIQRIGLSATIGNPNELLAWLARSRGGRVIGPLRPPADGDVTVDYVASLPNAITVLSRIFRGERRLVFADSRSRVEELAAGLRSAGLRTFVSHASLSADERRSAEAAFANEPDCAIVATSTLELGIDVGDLDRVVQVGAPPSIASFLQRMGRTGRRPGARRNCLFLATDEKEFLAACAMATLWREDVIERIVPPVRPAHIYAQQVMALALQEDGLTRPDIDRWLGDVCGEVPEADRAAVLRHMLLTGVLAEDAGVLGMGSRGEREFGRRHFGDLVAAFSSPLMLTVFHGPTELGTVHPTSLAQPSGDGPPILLLGGRSWKVTEVDWPRRRVSVIPIEAGGKSRWLGAGRHLSALVCRAAERIIAGTEPACTLSRRATAKLSEIREQLAFVDGRSLPVVSEGGGRVRVWCCAGGPVSASLAHAFAQRDFAITDWDDFSIGLCAPDADRVATAIASIEPAEARPMPPADLGVALKFSACLPDDLLRAVVGARLADSIAVNEALSRPARLVLMTCSNREPI
jgi:ATP-dependent Lhr-like helicase